MSGLFQLGKGSPPDFSDPVAFLASCHRKIEDRLTGLERVIAAVAEGDESVLPAAREALTAFVRHFDGAAAIHTLDEEASIWPRIQDPCLAELSAEHREHEAIYQAVRAVAQSIIAGRTAPGIAPDLALHGGAMIAAYREHIEKEERLLFPLIRALDERELGAIGLEMRMRRG